MAGILARKILMGKGADGYMRIGDWCSVTTGIGSAWEPFSFNRGAVVKGSGNSDFDWKEAANRIDDIISYDPNCQIFDERTIGGPLGMPISGY
jgi:hypothetical protein